MKRKKTWKEKVDIVKHSFFRIREHKSFAKKFYDNLFFLNPKIAEYFKNTDFEHQNKALMAGLNFTIGFLDETDKNARVQVIRISKTHSHANLNIHPHLYYYWIDALIMTARELDHHWIDDMEYYWREVIFFPVSFIISQHYKYS